MPRASSRASRQPIDRSIVVALHRVGGAWHAVSARVAGSATARTLVQVLATRSFDRTDRSSMARWVQQQTAGRVLVVVPASRVICRSFSLPNASPDRLQAALLLQAEAHLLGAVPQHRLGLSVLPGTSRGADGQDLRTGLLIGWPETGADDELELPLDPGAGELSHVADVAALAALLSDSTPDAPLLWLDRSEGAVAVAVAHAGGIVLRATRESFSAEQIRGRDDSWQRDIVRVVGETLLSVGVAGGEVRTATQAAEAALRSGRSHEEDGALLLLPEQVSQRLAREIEGHGDTPDTPAWWSRYGIAVGAVRCLAGGLEPLTRLQARRVEIRPSFIARSAEALSKPRTALTLAVLGIALVAFGPLAFAKARGALLQAKVHDLASLEAQNLEDAKRRAMYRELGRQTWPMSKLLADISNSAPQGMRLTRVVIDRGSGVTVEGHAVAHDSRSGQDNVARMARTMLDTGVFSPVTWDVFPPSGTSPGNRFGVKASVRDPFREHRWAPEDDFNVTSLAMRMYGEETTPGFQASADQGGAASGRGARRFDSDAEPSGSSAAAGPLAEVSVPAGSPPSAQASSAGASRRGSAAGPVRRGPEEPQRGSGDVNDPTHDPEHNPPDVDEQTAAGSDEAGGRSRGDRRAITRRGDSEGSGRASGAASRGDVDGGGAGVDMPPPLSDEAIAAMSWEQAQQALARVAKARQSPGVSDEEKARLKEESDRLFAHMRKVR